MGNSFLEEQLRRVRQLTEWMAQAHSDVAECTQLMARDREAVERGPLEVAGERCPRQTHARRDRIDDRSRRSSRISSSEAGSRVARPRGRSIRRKGR